MFFAFAKPHHCHLCLPYFRAKQKVNIYEFLQGEKLFSQTSLNAITFPKLQVKWSSAAWVIRRYNLQKTRLLHIASVTAEPDFSLPPRPVPFCVSSCPWNSYVLSAPGWWQPVFLPNFMQRWKHRPFGSGEVQLQNAPHQHAPALSL